ncbi:MAG: biopolymer transporter ExbD [Deltaproteobacteria bacterium]|jgi:biopolymer transport protein TolR|nr:biopolymer transporter ExbD [Deltaproteobacteria bacterium]
MQGPDLIHGEGETRSISDINVTPFIDVMLVLLIIFMVTAPLMMGGVKINLPKTTDNPMPRPENPLIVSLDANSQAFVDKDPVPDDRRKEVFRQLALESESGEVFVRGDGEVKYARMMDLMSELGQAGFARVTLVTSVAPASTEGADGTAQADGTAPADGRAPADSQTAAPATGSSSSAAPASAPSPVPAPAPAASPVPAAPASAPAPASPPAP